jgi:hypothetical protein
MRPKRAARGGVWLFLMLGYVRTPKIEWNSSISNFHEISLHFKNSLNDSLSFLMLTCPNSAISALKKQLLRNTRDFPAQIRLGEEQDQNLPASNLLSVEDIVEASETNELPKTDGGPDSCSCSLADEEPVLLYTGFSGVLSELQSLLNEGPLADSYLGTQVALGVLLRYIASEIARNLEESVVVDAYGVVYRSCMFLNEALDESVDKATRTLIEFELKRSIEVSRSIKEKLSYRGFTDSARPLRWVFSFTVHIVNRYSSSNLEESQRSLISRSILLLADFLLHEANKLEPRPGDEERCYDKLEEYLESIRRLVNDERLATPDLVPNIK